ncbi:hypothetical protein KT71_000108 [Congregibacter litoralis KT71]|uniref:Uncharacterized protein n=1 Tax=Congregibacter litoralis KT71 TaxID=314285 RepID=V7HVD5_9GAMM|nr:hypothetical protein KT71_000108 [Congregibacter litoralis KT71]
MGHRDASEEGVTCGASVTRQSESSKSRLIRGFVRVLADYFKAKPMVIVANEGQLTPFAGLGGRSLRNLPLVGLLLSLVGGDARYVNCRSLAYARTLPTAVSSVDVVCEASVTQLSECSKSRLLS